MSRFFKTLTEAGRLRQGTAGQDKTSSWGPLQSARVEMPPPFETARSTAWPAGGILETGETVASALPVETALLGTEAQVALDKRARLLPHSVDQAIVEHYRRLRTKLL